jgi:hypothetical protein
MRLISVCFVVALLVTPVAAQNSAKPWSEWSKKDVEKMLNDSAWGQTQAEERKEQTEQVEAVTQVAANKSADRQMGRTGESGETKSQPSIRYHVRFLSAKPVRAAFARMVLLTKTQPDEALTGQLQGFIDRSFADYIVVSVGVEVSDAKVGEQLMRALSVATAEVLKQNVYLERKDGKKLHLMEYRAPTEDGMGAKFVFQRVVDGQPFLSENDSVKFVAQFNERMKVNTRYKLSDMLYDGKLEY